jgi:hypothetical protein
LTAGLSTPKFITKCVEFYNNNDNNNIATTTTTTTTAAAVVVVKGNSLAGTCHAGTGGSGLLV